MLYGESCAFIDGSSQLHPTSMNRPSCRRRRPMNWSLRYLWQPSWEYDVRTIFSSGSFGNAGSVYFYPNMSSISCFDTRISPVNTLCSCTRLFSIRGSFRSGYVFKPYFNADRTRLMSSEATSDPSFLFRYLTSPTRTFFAEYW